MPRCRGSPRRKRRARRAARRYRVCPRWRPWERLCHSATCPRPQGARTEPAAERGSLGARAARRRGDIGLHWTHGIHLAGEQRRRVELLRCPRSEGQSSDCLDRTAGEQDGAASGAAPDRTRSGRETDWGQLARQTGCRHACTRAKRSPIGCPTSGGGWQGWRDPSTGATERRHPARGGASHPLRGVDIGVRVGSQSRGRKADAALARAQGDQGTRVPLREAAPARRPVAPVGDHGTLHDVFAPAPPPGAPLTCPTLVLPKGGGGLGRLGHLHCGVRRAPVSTG